ncbi:InsBcp2, partial [Escherichia coli FVEC1412]
ARKWTNSGDTSGLNRASAGCFTRMTGSGRRLLRTVFGERTMATLGRLMSLLSPFDVVIWMTDGWPLYESRLKGKLHVISKRYTQRIERHNLNLRQHLARLGRKSLSFSKSVELHDKVIGHYLNIKHYQ